MSETRPGGLGRGLSALLPAGTQSQPQSADAPNDAGHAPAPAAPGAALREIPIDEISPNPAQPRTTFEPDALQELADSIRTVGVLQPVIVRRRGAGYQLVAGERRVRAARLAGLRMIPAIVRDTADEAMRRDALVENIQRKNLNAIEEALAYRELIEELALTHEDVADRVSKSRVAVTNALRLLNLAPSVQQRIANDTLTAGHGRAIAGLSDPSVQERVAMRVSAEGLSVRATEDLVRTLQGAVPRAASPRQPSQPERSAGILEVEHRLAAMLDTRVRVEAGRRGRGRIVVEFADESDLDRIFRSIANE